MTQRFSKMMNSNKRKGRMSNPNSNKLGRSKYFSDKNMSCDGIYGNSRVTYTGASLVGCVVQIQVHDGNVYEGVLRTFSHQLDLVLEMAHKVSPKCAPVKGVSPTVSNLISSYPFEGGLHDKIVFKLSDVVTMQACNIDVDYAVKDAFTDTAISKFNGQVKERELEPWEGADSDSEDTPSSLALTIEEEDTNGWDANDMFRTNAEKYGVKSSYDNSLQEYTVALTKKDTEEWKQQEAKALKIAQEIETNTSYQSRIQLENGGDEEDRFSAVVRSSSAEDTTTSSKYILPQKRRSAPGIKRHTAPSSSPVHLSLKPYSAGSLPGKGKPFTTPEPPPPAPAPPKGVLPPADKSLEESEEAEPAKLPPEPKVAENVPPPLMSGPPPKMLPPRIERRRENEKKFAKQKGRMDEIEDFKKFSKNFNVLTEDVKECVETEEAALASQVERMKLEKEEEEEKCANVVKYSTLNPNAKEFVFNPNAKAFTPRSVPAPPPVPVQATPPPQPPPPLMAAPSPQMMAPQPLFTAMAPQYVMQAPVSVAISHHQPFVQHHTNHHHHPQQRFRKASAQSILAPTGLPGPSQLTVQYTTSPPGVLHAQPQPQTAVGYPQMNFVVGPRVVSPQPVGVIPTSHSVSYCDASHLPTHHLIMSAHPGAPHSAASTPHSIHQGAQQQQHPPQSQTPVLHPAPSPVHQGNHNQPPPPVYGHHALAAHHHHHHPGFPPGGPQPVVLMQQQPHHHHHQASHHHAAAALHHHHMLHQNPGLLPQMALIPTSTAMTSAAPSSVATPPYVQQHP